MKTLKNNIFSFFYLVRARYIFLFCICSFLSCKKFIVVEPPETQLESVTVFTSDATANAAVLGMYINMMQQGTSINLNPLFGQGGLACMAALTADELKSYFPTDLVLQQGYKNALVGNSLPFWTYFYKNIYNANAIIEGLNASKGLTPSLMKQLMGEALFVRAFNHFYLLNVFGDVPLVTSTDYKVNALIARTPQATVYQQIVADLKYARDNLAEDYSISGDERTRVNKWAAAAMLARVYLYTHAYDSAETQSTAVLDNAGLYSLDSLNDVFLKNSTEAIWQLQPVSGDIPNLDAYDYVLLDGPNDVDHPVAISEQLANAFENGDERKMNWVGASVSGGTTYYFPYKYKVNVLSDPVTEYYMMLRMGEQYLVRAEARAQQDDLQGAADDLNVIRSRAGLPNTTAATREDLLAAVQHERQVELFIEWGHRWFDLKRTGSVDSVMSVVTPLKGGIWNTNWQLYPLPQTELQLDPNLKQNPGY